MNEIAQVVGPAIAEKLVKGMSQEPFGGLGSYDVVVTFEPNQEFIDAGLGEDSMPQTFIFCGMDGGQGVFS